MTMFAAAAAGLLTTMGLALVRALLGPTAFDRILAVNTMGTKTVLLFSVYGFLTGRPDFLDIAMVYALMNFITIIAILKLSAFATLGDTEHELGGDGS